MNLAFVWGAGAVLSGWIILRLVGGEREQKLREFEANRPPQLPTAAAPVQKPSGNPTPPQRKAA